MVSAYDLAYIRNDGVIFFMTLIILLYSNYGSR